MGDYAQVVPQGGEEHASLQQVVHEARGAVRVMSREQSVGAAEVITPVHSGTYKEVQHIQAIEVADGSTEYVAFRD